MTVTLSNRISLEGGDDIRRQLDSIAESAEQLFNGVKALSDSFGKIDSSGLDRAGTQLQQTKDSASRAASEVQGFGSGLLGFASGAAAGLAALAVAAAGVASGIAASAAAAAAALSETSAKLGLTVGAYQNLKSAADDADISVDQLNKILGNIDKAATQAAGSLDRVLPTDTAGRFVAAGASLQQIAGALGIAQQSTDAFGRTAGSSIDLIQKFGDTTVRIMNGVSQSTFDAAKSSNSLKQGAAGAAQALSELGISAAVLSKLTPEQRIELLATQLNKIPDSAGKAALAARLFGDEWRKALEFISSLPGALSDADESVRKLSDGEVKAGKALNDAIKDLGSAFDALKNRIGDLLAPGKTATAEWLTSLIDGANQLLKDFISADDAKKKLLEDGKFNLFGDLDLDKFQQFVAAAGNSGLAQAIGLIRDVSRDLVSIWTGAIVPAGQLVIAAFQGIADVINSSFGSDISGRFIAVVVVLGLVTGAFSALRSVISPIITLFGFVASSIGSLGALLLGAGLAARAFWTEFRAGGTAAVGAVRAESVGFADAFAQLMRGNLSSAWTLFKNAALDAFGSAKAALADIFGGQGTLLTTITRLISGVALAASGLAAIFNAIFGTNLNAEGLLLVAVLLQLVGAFGALAATGRFVVAAMTPVGASFLAIGASAIILARQFPDLGASWQLVTEAFSNLLNGDFDKAFQQLGAAFSGVWDNLRQQGVLTWAILGAGAIAVTSAVAGLVGQVRTLATLLLAMTPTLAALASAGLIAGDFTREADPAQKAIEKINSDFAQGKINAEEYNRQLQQLDQTTSDLGKSSAGTGSRGFADTWKTALDQIKAALGDTTTTAKTAADGIASPLKQAAGQVTDGFKTAAGNVGNAFSGTPEKAFRGFQEVSRGVWQKISDDASGAANSAVNSFNSAGKQIDSGFRQIAPGVWEKIPDAAKQAADQASQAFDGMRQQIDSVVSQSQAAIQRAFDSINTGSLDRFLTSAQQDFQGAGQAGENAGQRISTAMQAIQTSGTQSSGVLQTIAAYVQQFGQSFDGVGSSASSSLSGVTSSLDSVIAKLSEATVAAQAMAQALSSVASDGSTISPFPGFAGGTNAPLSGPGTTTSDSIPAWLSVGEVVLQARAVAALVSRFGGGVLGLLNNFHMLGGRPMPTFSVGGMVDNVARRLSFEPLRLAGGGMVAAPARAGPLHPVNLVMPDGRKLSGLSAPSSVIDRLSRELTLERLSTSGRQPKRGRS